MLPAFLASQALVRGTRKLVRRAPVSSATIPLVACRSGSWSWRSSKTKGQARTRRTTSLPLTISWTRLDRERSNPNALAAVRRGAARGHAARCHGRSELHRVSARQPARLAQRSRPTNGRIEFRPTSAASEERPDGNRTTCAPWTRSSRTPPSSWKPTVS